MSYHTSTMQTSWARSRNRSSYWMLYVLVLAAVICLPLSIRTSGWVPDAGRLIWAAFWGLGTGFLLAQVRAPDWMTWLGSMILGLEYSVQYAGRLLPSLGTLLGDLGGAIVWLWRAVVGQSVAPPWPFARSMSYTSARLAEFVTNLRGWVGAAQAGTESQDLTMLWLLVSLAVWLISWHAGYALIRQRRPFTALLPLGIAIVSNASFTYVGFQYVQIYLALTLVTLVIANVDRLERLWQKLGVDFAAELRHDMLLAGGAISAVLVALALFLPYHPWNDAVWFFWNHVGPTVETFYDRLDKAFAGRDPVPEPTPDPGEAAAAGHRVASGSDWSEAALFSVVVSDPPPPPEHELEAMSAGGDLWRYVTKRYWRQRVYDVYTGSGWETSPYEVVEYEAGTDWVTPAYAGEEVTQTYTLLGLEGGLVPAVNLPVRVEDQPYAVVDRGEDDMTALAVNAPSYTVVSVAPHPTVEELRAAEDPYPEWLAARYLALPEIPQRVRDLAQQIVDEADATTRYDKALAIEAYLRNTLYDLEVPPPAPDEDVVDYFLFETQRGYCDYTATAMVVMLRSVGVAARYAQGFGQGRYDYEQGAYVVRESNRHAWPEVYFPDEGWVEFEPTPVQGRWVRPVAMGGGAGQGATTASEEGGRIPRVIWYAAILAAVLAWVIVWPPRYLHRRPAEPRTAIAYTYAQLLRAARRLHLEPVDGQTPREYLAYLAEAIETRGQFGGEAAHDVGVIGRGYELACYSQRELTAADRERVEGAWARLRARMWRVRLMRAARPATT